MIPMPENAVTLTASNFFLVVLLIFDVSDILCRPSRPALLKVRGELHDAETLLAVRANCPRVDLLETY